MSLKNDRFLQKEEIKQDLNRPMVSGELWFILDIKWWNKWKMFVGFDGSNDDAKKSSNDKTANGVTASKLLREEEEEEISFLYPGKLDNTILICPNTNLVKSTVMPDIDFVLIPERSWVNLRSVYGSVYSDFDFEKKLFSRQVVTLPNRSKRVEIQPIQLNVYNFSYPSSSPPETMSFPRCFTIDELVTRIRTHFKWPFNSSSQLVRKSQFDTSESFSVVSLPGNTLIEDSDFRQNDIVVIQEYEPDTRSSFKHRREDGSHLASQSTSSNGHGDAAPPRQLPSPQSSSTTSMTAGRRPRSQYGVCGLGNMGNTCFMNSALQCVSHVQPLTEYFLRPSSGGTASWKAELNTTNPLGMRGEIAVSYANLTRALWTGKETYTLPREFKTAVSRFAPQFCGFSQHDSQELMMFLLDGLHEDLNRIKQKPYIEVRDAEGRPDQLVAAEAWDNHKRRNDSIVVDLFHGLLKSRVTCPDCGRISVTFDPYSCLSVPLPVNADYVQTVFLVESVPGPVLKLCLSVPKSGTVGDLVRALGQQIRAPVHSLAEYRVTEVYDCKFYKFFQTNESLKSITTRDVIYVFHLPEMTKSNCVLFKVEHLYKDKSFFIPFLMTMVVDEPLGSNQSVQTSYQKLARLLVGFLSRQFQFDGVSVDSRTGRIQLTEPGDRGEADKESAGLRVVFSRPATASSEDLRTAERDRLYVDLSHLVQIFYINRNMRVAFHPDSEPIQHGYPDLISRIPTVHLLLDWTAEGRSAFNQLLSGVGHREHVSCDLVHNQHRQSAGEGIKLVDCLQLFTKPECLGQEDMWYCSNCKEHKPAEKKFDIWTLPEVLILHLKRFQCVRYNRDKIDTLVTFPVENLDLSQWALHEPPTNCVYDLVSVSNHMGGLGGGHYNAYAKNYLDQLWYKFDDSFVSDVECPQDVVTRAAYVLIYQRRRVGASMRSPSVQYNGNCQVGMMDVNNNDDEDDVDDEDDLDDHNELMNVE